MDKENAVQGSWNKKRIIIAIILLMLLGVGAYFFKTKILSSEPPKSVKGVSVKENKSSEGEEKIDIQEAVKDTVKKKLEDLKKEAMKIDVAEIASSSPQIQKLIKDLSSIRDYPANQAKEICEKVCGNL